MATAEGSITLADIVDGQAGPVAILSNENHTFAGAADGAVSSLSGFSCAVDFYVGATEYTYVNNATPTQGQWSINESSISVTPSGADITVNVNDTNGTITIADANTVATGFVDAQTDTLAFTITIPFRFKIGSNSVATINRQLSFTKALGGSAQYVRTTANRQTMAYAYNAGAPKSTEADVVLSSVFTNFTGTEDATWSYRAGSSGTFSTITSSQGTVSGTNDSTLTVSPTQYDTALGNNSVVTYRCTRDSQFDQVSVYKIEDAPGGVIVIIEADGATVFKNNPSFDSTDSTTYTDLTARIYRGGTELTLKDNGDALTYQWKKNGTNIAASDLPTQPSNHGATSKDIRVSAEDTITDNGADQISCVVDY